MLRIGLLDKKVALSRIHRLMLIEESVIGVSQNWITYGSLISLPPSVIANGIMPFLLLGAFKGCYKTDTKYSTQVINIAKRTTLKTLIKGLGYALTTGSFISLGLEEITLDTVFSENIGYSREYNQYYDDLSMIQYISCALAFFNHLARHPRLPVWVQDYGRYGSNISNTLGSILLDYFATFSIMGMILELTIGDSIALDQAGLLTFFYGMQAVLFLYCTFTILASNPDLPEYSTEFKPSEKTIGTICADKIQHLKAALGRPLAFLRPSAHLVHLDMKNKT